jgi:glycosyltransferase involved in cell wall biosynthesis
MQGLTVKALPLPPPGKTGWPWTEDTLSLEAVSDGRSCPRISIITPSLNQGPFVEEAIRSVLLQDYPNVELIVADGGSTDGGVETIGKYRDRLAHWICERDGGPANALNKGFRLATGEILGILNADDLLLPGSLAKIAREFRMHPSADVVSGHGYLANASGVVGAPFISDRWNLARFAYDACVLFQAATFFRRRRFQEVNGFNERNQTAWDMELWADLALAGATFHRFDEFLAVYRVHGASITGRPQLKRQRRQDRRAVRQKVKGRLETPRDRLYSTLHRMRKFSGHPLRTLNQRLFFHSTLNRWSV